MVGEDEQQRTLRLQPGLRYFLSMPSPALFLRHLLWSLVLCFGCSSGLRTDSSGKNTDASDITFPSDDSDSSSPDSDDADMLEEDGRSADDAEVDDENGDESEGEPGDQASNEEDDDDSAGGDGADGSLPPGDAGIPSDDQGDGTASDTGDEGEQPDSGMEACGSCGALVFTDAYTTPQHGGTGGSAFSELCRTGFALVGLLGHKSSDPEQPWVHRLQGVCGRLTVSSEADHVLVSDIYLLAEHGLSGDVAWQRACPRDEVVVGVNGRSGLLLDGIQITCARLQVSGAPGSYVFTRGTESRSTLVGNPTGGSAFAEECAEDELAVGLAGRSGRWMDAYASICATPQAD